MSTDTSTPAAALPAPSPALRAHMAADRLRRAAQAALADMDGNDYWQMGWKTGVDSALGGPSGELAGLITPELVLELADWLDAIGTEAVRHAAHGMGNLQEEITDGHPDTITQHILGED